MPQAAPMTSKSTIVFISDPELARAVCDILEEAGYKPVPAQTSAKVLELIGTLPKPCLLLLDPTYDIPVTDYLAIRAQDVVISPVPQLSPRRRKSDAERIDRDLLIDYVRQFYEQHG